MHNFSNLLFVVLAFASNGVFKVTAVPVEAKFSLHRHSSGNPSSFNNVPMAKRDPIEARLSLHRASTFAPMTAEAEVLHKRQPVVKPKVNMKKVVKTGAQGVVGAATVGGMAAPLLQGQNPPIKRMEESSDGTEELLKREPASSDVDGKKVLHVVKKVVPTLPFVGPSAHAIWTSIENGPQRRSEGDDGDEVGDVYVMGDLVFGN